MSEAGVFIDSDQLNSNAKVVVQPLAENEVHNDVVACALNVFKNLPQKVKPQPNEWTCAAAIVAVRRNEEGHNDYFCLSFGTGTRCCGQHQYSDDTLRDCHAEVMARKGFQQFLWGHLENSSGSSSPQFHSDRLSTSGDKNITQTQFPILQYVGEDERGDDIKWEYILAKDVSLWLYSSHLPCGRATQVPLTADDVDLASKDHFEFINRTGAKNVPNRALHPSVPEPEGDHLHGLMFKSMRSDTPEYRQSRSLSCSDKICRWQALGLQGTLLSGFYNVPLRLEGVVIGGPLFDEQVVKNALCALSRGWWDDGDGCRELIVNHCTTLSFPFECPMVANSQQLQNINAPSSGTALMWWANQPTNISTNATTIVKSRGHWELYVGHQGTLQNQSKALGPIASKKVTLKRFKAFLRNRFQMRATEMKVAPKYSQPAKEKPNTLRETEACGKRDLPPIDDGTDSFDEYDGVSYNDIKYGTYELAPIYKESDDIDKTTKIDIVAPLQSKLRAATVNRDRTTTIALFKNFLLSRLRWPIRGKR